MDSTNLQLIIVAVLAVATPLVTAIVTSRNIRLVKEQDWARQDKVAKETKGQLEVIHTLVNSNMTAAKQGQYDALVVQLAMMIEVIDLKQGQGAVATEAATTAITETKEKIAELRKELDERQRQAKLVEQQQANTAKELAS